MILLQNHLYITQDPSQYILSNNSIIKAASPEFSTKLSNFRCLSVESAIVEDNVEPCVKNQLPFMHGYKYCVALTHKNICPRYKYFWCLTQIFFVPNMNMFAVVITSSVKLECVVNQFECLLISMTTNIFPMSHTPNISR